MNNPNYKQAAYMYTYNPVYPAINNLNNQIIGYRRGLGALSFVAGILVARAWIDRKDIKDLERKVAELQKKTEESGSK